MYRFKNKVILITGAASGIGEATTRRITSEGGTVVMADFAREKNELLARGTESGKSRSFSGLFLSRRPGKLPEPDRTDAG